MTSERIKFFDPCLHIVTRHSLADGSALDDLAGGESWRPN